ncbi:MAG: transcription antitermination factor NusB [Acidobacteriota bacterium]|nr:transcription antitermination factor NusB [Acidobacteriota bacterium]
MGFLRKARECALQMLYQWELAHAEPSRIEAMFWKATRGSSEQRFLANKLFEGAAADAPVTDELITRHAENWRLDRLAAIDRNILRLAVHELRRGEAPEKVVINEALELAKKYSEPDVVGFLNGVLDAIRKSLAAAKDA